MGHFVSGTKRIELGMHACGRPEWWDVKSKLSQGDKDGLLDALTHLELRAGGQDDKAYIGRLLGALRRAATANWQLWDDDGHAIPFDRDMIDDLDPDDSLVEKIDTAIAALNPFRPKIAPPVATPDSTDGSPSTPASENSAVAVSN